ncbi:MAG: hypothetical protein ACOC5K_02065 [Chloroflexota bacterium]
MPRNIRVDVPVQATIETRDGYLAAKTRPFDITVYAESREGLLVRARKAVDLLLDAAREREDLVEYLNRKRVSFSVTAISDDEAGEKPGGSPEESIQFSAELVA